MIGLVTHRGGYPSLPDRVIPSIPITEAHVPTPRACAQSYHPGSGSHGQRFRHRWGSPAWCSRRAHFRPFTAEAIAKHFIKRQLHRKQVVSVGWEPQNGSPTACVWRWDEKIDPCAQKSLMRGFFPRPLTRRPSHADELQ